MTQKRKSVDTETSKTKLHDSWSGIFNKAKKTTLEWKYIGDSIIYHVHGSHDSCSDKNDIAAFDLDGTLWKTKSGKVHAADENDWQLWDASVLPKLEHQSKTHRLVVFSNQKDLIVHENRFDIFTRKLADFLKKIKVPMVIFASLKADYNRKPHGGMWENMCKVLNINEVCLDNSFYVGDAAGRVANWETGKKKDWADSDRKFALNIGIDFKTPEEYFLERDTCVKFELTGFNPNLYKVEQSLEEYSSKANGEMIIFCGIPGSGKSSFYEKHFKNYVHINSDTLKSKAIAVCEREISKGNSVVVDNTNVTKESRAKFLQLAKKANFTCRCFYFAIEKELAQHLNTIRSFISDRKAVPKLVYNTMLSKFEEPALAEGFDEIKTIKFSYDQSLIPVKLFYSYS